eukprot:gene10933-3007_t
MATNPSTAQAGEGDLQQPNQVQLSVDFRTEFTAYTRSSTHDVNSVVHIKAPDYEGEESSRGTTDIVTVIDTSGSMSGSKLQLAKSTLNFLVKNLTQNDRLSLVSYDSNIQLAFPLTKMDSSGKKFAEDAIAALHAGSCTNLSGGLFKGIEQMQTRDTKNNVSSILLMTDGIANEGLVGQQLLDTTRRLVGERSDFTIYTFGYGSDHEADLLRNISEIGNGMYYFIEGDESIAEAFGDCLGGLLSVVAQNISVQINTENNATIEALLMDVNHTFSPDRKQLSITLADIQAEEERDIVLKLRIPSLPEEDKNEASTGNGRNMEYTYATANIEYVDVISAAFLKRHANMTLQRPSQPPVQALPDKNVTRQIRRVEATEAMRSARELADHGDFTTARENLSKIRTTLEAERGGDSYLDHLTRDLDDCMEGVSSKEAYRSKGACVMSSAFQMHGRQRATKASPSLPKAKMMMRKKAETHRTLTQQQMDPQSVQNNISNLGELISQSQRRQRQVVPQQANVQDEQQQRDFDPDLQNDDN